MCIGTLHRPIHLIFVYFNTASVIIPDGLVKLISHALGHNSFISLEISKITGIVLRAFAKPPGPTVS